MPAPLLPRSTALPFLRSTADEGTCRGYPFVSRGSRAKRCRSSVPSGRSMANSPRSSRARARAAATASSRLTNSAIIVPLCSSSQLEPFGRTRKRSLGICPSTPSSLRRAPLKRNGSTPTLRPATLRASFDRDQHPKRLGVVHLSPPLFGDYLGMVQNRHYEDATDAVSEQHRQSVSPDVCEKADLSRCNCVKDLN
jgi:hypothetical protein